VAGMGQAHEIRYFAARWRRWTEIVRCFALQKKRRYNVLPEEYHKLHGELLEYARRHAATADAAGLELLRAVEEMVAPWVSPEALSRADREILLQLLGRCEEVKELLEGGRGRRSTRRRAMVALGAAVVLFGLVLMMGSQDFWPAAAGVLRWPQRFVADVRDWSVERKLILVGGVISVLLIVMLRSSGRR
jgi:hypothetical protein